MSSLTVFATALVPGVAEHIKQAANNSGNLGIYGAAEGTIVFRNAFYVTTAASGAFAILAAAMWSSTPFAIPFTACSIAGAGLAVYSGKQMHHYAKMFMKEPA